MSEPALRGARPNLRSWYEFVTLPSRTDADDIHLWSISVRDGINRRAAFGTEALLPLRTAFAGLDVDLRTARQNPKRVLSRERDRSKCRARKGLAVGAMTDHDVLGIDLGLISDVPAMTTAIDLHDVSRAWTTIRCSNGKA